MLLNSRERKHLCYINVTILPQPHYVQGDQLYMAVYFWHLVKAEFNVHILVKSDLSSFDIVHVYTGQVTFTRYLKHTAMFYW